MSDGLSQTLSPSDTTVPSVVTALSPDGNPASWNDVTAEQFVPGQFAPTVPVTGNVPFQPAGENPARVTWAPTFSATPFKTATVPVVPDSLAAVTVSAVIEGGFVPAKHDPAVFAVHTPAKFIYCKQAG